MTKTKTTNIRPVDFDSTVFPTARDMAVWDGMTPEQQRAVILKDIREGLRGPAAHRTRKEEIMMEVQAELNRAL